MVCHITSEECLRLSLGHITFPFERINHAWSEMIYQASHQGLQHPLKQKYLFPSVIVIMGVF
jgi:hypothetical protein